jgi:ABC-type glycerol-3-phosphate transport system substrate-binding protein
MSAAGLLVVLCACLSLPDQSDVTQSPQLTGNTPTPALAVTPDSTPGAVIEPTPTADSGGLVLVVWMPDVLSPAGDAPGQQEFLEQLAAFDETRPDIRVQIYTKRSYGEGSILSYLSTALPVAPDILPDITLLDQDGVAQAATEGLIAPVGMLVDPALLEAMYPAAVSLGTVDGDLYGISYLLEIEHLVYRNTVFRKPPNSFQAILDARQPLIFPAGSSGSVNRTTLLQYMAAGGLLADENDGKPLLNATILTGVLAFYSQAHARGLIGTEIFQVADTTAGWLAYREHRANITVVSSTLYLKERAQVNNTSLTWIPTPKGDPWALATSWLWVMVTRDPDRQAASMALLEFLMEPVNQGRYSQAVHWLPSQYRSLAVWGGTDSYPAFAGVLLQVAQPLPDTKLPSSIAIQKALEAVLLDDVMPVQAAAEAEQMVSDGGIGVSP